MSFDFTLHDYTSLEITSGTTLEPLIVVYKKGTKIIKTLTIDSYTAGGHPVFKGITLTGFKLNISECRFVEAIVDEIADLSTALSSEIVLSRQTNDIRTLHLFDTRFTNVTQAGHTTLLNATMSDLNDSGNTNWIMPATATTFDVVSTSAQDAFGGTGIYLILLQGLDQDLNVINVFLQLTGTTPVTTPALTGSFRALNISIALAGGTPGSGSVGIITISATTGGQVFGRYLVDDTSCEVGRYTVPNGMKLIGTSISVSGGKGVDATLKLFYDIPGQLPFSSGDLYPSAGWLYFPNVAPQFTSAGESFRVRAFYNSGGSGVRYMSTIVTGVLASIEAWDSLLI